jgi:hypothetical protein
MDPGSTDLNRIPKVEQNSEKKKAPGHGIFRFFNPACHVIITVYIFFCSSSSKAHKGIKSKRMAVQMFTLGKKI